MRFDAIAVALLGVAWTVCAGTPASRSQLGASGRTTLLVGQVYSSEYDSYRRAMGLPAGSSHYGEIYNGRVNQGDDGLAGHPLSHLEFVHGLQDSAIVQVAISWKDNPDLSRHPKDACGDFIGKRVYQVNQDIADGLYDAQIDEFAELFAAMPDVTFLLRVEYEVSQFAFSWKPTAPCPVPGKSVDFSDPAIIDNAPYRNAFRHVAERLRVVRKLSNVKFVFHPVRGIGDAKAMYPGADVVDFVALSLFADDVCFGDHNCKGTIDGNARQVFQWARDSLRKPRMVAECAWQPLNAEDPGARARATSDSGVIDYLARLRAIVDSFDVSVVSYINSDWRAHGWDSAWWGDSRVENRPKIAAWWKKNIAEDPRFLMGIAKGAAGLGDPGLKSPMVVADPRGWTTQGLGENGWELRDMRGHRIAVGRGNRVEVEGLEAGFYFLRTGRGNLLLSRIRTGLSER